jgi:hypothetical protein
MLKLPVYVKENITMPRPTLARPISIAARPTVLCIMSQMWRRRVVAVAVGRMKPNRSCSKGRWDGRVGKTKSQDQAYWAYVRESEDESKSARNM